MSDSDSIFERELRDLSPAAPPAGLATRIARDLANPSRPPAVNHSVRRALWLSWSVTLAAAAAAAVAWWPAASTPAAMPAIRPAAELAVNDHDMVPVGTSNVLTEARDEGIVVLEDGRPARRVRLHFVDTVRLRDAQGGAEIAVSRPREELRFVPVNLY